MSQVGLCRWQDDLTVRTYQRDAAAGEVVLRDRSGKDENPSGYPQPGRPVVPWETARSKVEAVLKGTGDAGSEAFVYRQPKTSPYAMIQVWFTNGKVSRVMGIHRGKSSVQPNEVADTLRKAWSRDLDGLGALRRQESRRGPLMGAYFWHDDRTRIQTVVRRDGDSGRVMTECTPGPSW